MSASTIPPDDLPENPDATLAAEYVLRLLDPATEAACVERLGRDRAFAAEVERWQIRFAALDDDFEPVTAPTRLRAHIEERLFGRPPSLAERLWSSAGLWRGIAAAAVALALFAVLARPAPQPGPGPQPPLVATVAPPDGSLQLVAVLDPEAALLRFTHVSGAPSPGRSFELWLLPEGETVPVSLGLVPDDTRFERPLPSRFVGQVGPGDQILVSDEAAGGSITGAPGPVVAGGRIGVL